MEAGGRGTGGAPGRARRVLTVPPKLPPHPLRPGFLWIAVVRVLRRAGSPALQHPGILPGGCGPVEVRSSRTQGADMGGGDVGRRRGAGARPHGMRGDTASTPAGEIPLPWNAARGLAPPPQPPPSQADGAGAGRRAMGGLGDAVLLLQPRFRVLLGGVHRKRVCCDHLLGPGLAASVGPAVHVLLRGGRRRTLQRCVRAERWGEPGSMAAWAAGGVWDGLIGSSPSPCAAARLHAVLAAPTLPDPLAEPQASWPAGLCCTTPRRR